MGFDSEQYVANVVEAVRYIKTKIGDVTHGNHMPSVSLTLGSGLGDLADQIRTIIIIPYSDIPNFPKLTVEGHKGELVVGSLNGVSVIGLSGRKHYYEVAHEPYGMMEVVFPVHVMASLGVKTYFSTNAVGGLNLNYGVGDMMVIKDHIDLYMPDPLVGPHLDFGDNLYFQPQNIEYDPNLRKLFLKAAAKASSKSHTHEGIYGARTGRTYETAATCRVLRLMGADTVGMSTIPEVIVATNRRMRTIGVSVVTNKITADGTNATSHEEVTKILNSEPVRNRLKNTIGAFFQLGREQNVF